MKIHVRFFLTIVLLLSLGLTILAQTQHHGQDGTLHGDVADIVNVPIRNAFVLVHNDSGTGDVTPKLDEHGRFQLPLAPNLYDVFVAAPGFVPFCKRVQVSSDRATTFKARLKPDEEHLQQSSP